MSSKRHGLSIGIERHDDEVFLVLKAIGKLTHTDYETITPLIDSALGAVTDPEVRVLFDATELDGWDLRAAWDDLKIGLKHGNEFRKIAIYGNRKWQEFAVRVGAWFINGEVEFFATLEDALKWLRT